MEMKYSAFGWGMDRIPDSAYRMMVCIFRLINFFRGIAGAFSRRLSSFGIREGHTVIDYGCGPGGYLKDAGRFVRAQGRVYAVDIHELAI